MGDHWTCLLSVLFISIRVEKVSKLGFSIRIEDSIASRLVKKCALHLSPDKDMIERRNVARFLPHPGLYSEVILSSEGSRIRTTGNGQYSGVQWPEEVMTDICSVDAHCAER